MNNEIKQEAATMAGVWALAGLVAIFLFQMGVVTFRLLHTFAEFVAILIAVSVFLMAWNGRRFLDNGTLRLIGTAYLLVGILNLIHTLASVGFELFPGGNLNLASQFWLSARIVQAAALACAPFFVNRKIDMRVALAAFSVLSLALVFSILVFPVFPAVNQLDGTVSAFTIFAEIAILTAMGVALLRLINIKNQVEERVYTWLVGSILLTIISEALLASPSAGDGLIAALGHFFNLAAFYLIYKTMIETGFTRPMEVLFSDLMKNRESLQKERDFINGVLETANAMILVTDESGKIIRFNRALEDISGHRSEEMEGRYIWESSIFPGGQDEVRQFFDVKLSSRRPVNFEQHILSAAGEEIEVTWTTGVGYNRAGRPELIIGTGIDISDRKKVENELRYLSSHDILTGLYNRAFFEAEMLRLADSDNFPVSIVVSDLDGLKQVNDSQGHLMGDKLIQRAAHILRSAFRGEDIIARIGGDEFAVILPRADAAIASHSGKRVLSILDAYNQVNPENPLRLSLGFSTCSAGYQLMEAFKKADSAMYAQKNKHRDEAPEL